MAAIRCPQCGMITQQDDVSYPQCGQCHEDLARCELCRHVDASGCMHPRGLLLYSPDGEAAKRCPHYQSIYEAKGPRMLWKIPAPVWVSALILVIMLSLTAAMLFIDPAARYFRGNPLRVETTVPQQVVVGHNFIITMRLTNLLQQPSSKIYIEIDPQFMKSVESGLPWPEPKMSRIGDRFVLEYEGLPAGGAAIVQLPFTPRWSGTAKFIARLYAPSNQLQHEVRVPITVVDGVGSTPLEPIPTI